MADDGEASATHWVQWLSVLVVIGAVVILASRCLFGDGAEGDSVETAAASTTTTSDAETPTDDPVSTLETAPSAPTTDPPSTDHAADDIADSATGEATEDTTASVEDGVEDETQDAVVTSDTTAAPLERFESVATYGSHACAIRDDRTLVCWGSNISGQAEPPEGEFTHVAVGSSHSCAIRTDGHRGLLGCQRFRRVRSAFG